MRLNFNDSKSSNSNFQTSAILTIAIISLTITALQSNAEAQATPEEKPAFSIVTRALEANVVIDKDLKAYPKLYDELLAEGRRQVVRWRADADKERVASPEMFTDGRKWGMDRNYSQRSVIDRYVSILREDGTFQGGAHPSSVADTILWDTVAQKRISIRPFFTETVPNGPTMKTLTGLARIAVAVAKMQRDDQIEKMPPEKFVEQNDEIRNGIQPDLLKLGPVSLTPSTAAGKSSGLTLHYSAYAVGSYAEGAYTVFVPWMAFKACLTPEGERIFGGDRPDDDVKKFDND